jgi:DNA-directed RNA polymerase subunit RPC12/RpoP
VGWFMSSVLAPVSLSVRNVVLNLLEKRTFQGDGLYRCINCKKIIENIDDRIRCPYCGQRVLTKLRPQVIKRVQAR